MDRLKLEMNSLKSLTEPMMDKLIFTRNSYDQFSTIGN